MEININKKDIFWSYGARFFQLASSILLLPFILKMVPTEELGVWYIFITISSFVMLLDFGFSPTIMRNVTYVFSGVKVLHKEGFDNTTDHDNNVDYNLLKSLIYGIKKIYRLISLVGCFLMFTAGAWYIYRICSPMPNPSKYVFIWFLFATSTSINLYYLYYFPLLMGRGLIKKQNQVIVLSRATNLLVSLIGILLGYGLLAMVLGVLISTIITRFFSYKIFYSGDIKKYLSKALISNKNIFSILWTNSYKMGIFSLAIYLITNSGLFVVTSYSDLGTVASYGLTCQIIATLVSVSQILFGAYIPTFNSLRVKGNINILKEKFSLTMVLSLGIFIIGASFILIFGNRILEIIRPNTLLLPAKYLFCMLLISLLDFNHNNCATIITTNNTVPFAKPMLISGLLIITLSVVLYQFTSLGLWSVILSQGVVQLLYNNWRWPYMLCKDLQMSYFRIVKQGISQVRHFAINKLKITI